VAASITHLGLVARLIAPVLAVAAGGGVPDLAAGRLLDLAAGFWQPPLTSTAALSLPRAPSSRPLGTVLTEGPVAEVGIALARLGTLSARVLAGNVASAVNGAALQLGPDAYPATVELLAALPYEDSPPGPGFTRRSCCLLYRAPGRGYCGDCVLARR